MKLQAVSNADKKPRAHPEMEPAVLLIQILPAARVALAFETGQPGRADHFGLPGGPVFGGVATGGSIAICVGAKYPALVCTL